ncbi:hypothetical protein B0A54_10290 [Friedmanniomyces endolithicus]|uniref:N-acetylglucosamine-induced protein 1 n=1 Tax=Friedmanniomyces endolithicus TaxID=329885 RepID=A0A4V5N7J7_9PEZI|nr:hypothetical protein B0A54_10290 [Friedmanniomyces endolithicus]
MAPNNPNPPSTPFWNVNVPPSEHTETCPGFLTYAIDTNPRDRAILSTPDSDYIRQSWPQVQPLVRENRPDLFQRVPSDLRLYKEYCAKLVEEYGSVMRFVVEERLGWGGGKVDGEVKGGLGDAVVFDEANYKILQNDWPYGIDSRIVHLVVWTKFTLLTDPATEDLTPEAHAEIERFVDETFVAKCGREKVVWFRNWTSLKSIQAVEHFHVMLFDPDAEFVRQVTEGDVALAEKVKKGDGLGG